MPSTIVLSLVRLLISISSWTASQAKQLNVTGYAKNTDEGTVVGEAQGQSRDVEKFVEHLKKGPSASKVAQVEQKEIATKSGESGFER